MVSAGVLKQPLTSSRTSTREIRRRMLDYLRSSSLEPGSRLATEAELVQAMNVSRSTVRRALDPLEKAGWIDRRAGAGTFVGPRVRELVASGRVDDASDGNEATAAAARLQVRRSRGIVRVAVLIYNIGDLANDWYTPAILEGLDSVGDDQGVVIELLGDRQHDIDAISRRLELSRPDVLICLSNKAKHAFVIRDAQRLGIHCFVSGTPLAGLEVPGVSEDNRQAVRLVMEHLDRKGHRRIGLALPRLVEPWVFERLEAYTAAVQTRGLAPAVHWTNLQSSADSVGQLEQFIRANALTALIPGHIDSMRSLDALVQTGRLSVPGDLSAVSFENDHPERRYLGIAEATRIRFPLREMGHQLALMARRATEGEAIGSLLLLPAELIEGKSVASPREACEGNLEE